MHLPKEERKEMLKIEGGLGGERKAKKKQHESRHVNK